MNDNSTAAVEPSISRAGQKGDDVARPGKGGLTVSILRIERAYQQLLRMVGPRCPRH